MIYLKTHWRSLFKFCEKVSWFFHLLYSKICWPYNNLDFCSYGQLLTLFSIHIVDYSISSKNAWKPQDWLIFPLHPLFVVSEATTKLWIGIRVWCIEALSGLCMYFRVPLFKDSSDYRAERHDLWPRLWLFFPLFSSLLKKEGRRRVE